MVEEGRCRIWRQVCSGNLAGAMIRRRRWGGRRVWGERINVNENGLIESGKYTNPVVGIMLAFCDTYIAQLIRSRARHSRGFNVMSRNALILLANGSLD